MDEQAAQPMPQQAVTPPQPSLPPQPVVLTPKNPYNRMHLFLMAAFVLAVVACVSFYLGMVSQKSSDSVVNPYLKTTAVTSTPIHPTATSAPDPTANWTIYSNAKYGYSVKYPTDLITNEQNTNYYYVEFKNAGDSSALPPYVVSVIPTTFIATDVAAYNYMSSDWITSFFTIKEGESKTTSSGAVFTKLPDTTIDGQNAIVVGVVATGYKQQRVYVKENNNYYMFSNYYQKDSELVDFKLFLSSVKFN